MMTYWSIIFWLFFFICGFFSQITAITGTKRLRAEFLDVTWVSSRPQVIDFRLFGIFRSSLTFNCPLAVPGAKGPIDLLWHSLGSYLGSLTTAAMILSTVDSNFIFKFKNSNWVHFIRQDMTSNRANLYFILAASPVGYIVGGFLK